MTLGGTDPLVPALRDAQNTDGGWPASTPGPSNTEVTALAVMALSAAKDADVAGAVAAGRQWVITRQRRDGGWSSAAAVDESSWMTAPAVLALSGDAAAQAAAIRGGQWLLAREGAGLPWWARAWLWLYPQNKPKNLDTEIKGWPWSADTFSWVEPTAYALLALKKLRTGLPDARRRDRIEQGERLIHDRVCPEGGWNYGNKRVLGESLSPYADTTAVALLALHDREPREDTRRSLRVLEHLIENARSGLALGWSVLCFDLYGLPTASLRSRLREQYADTRFLGKIKPLALGALALNDGARSFRP